MAEVLNKILSFISVDPELILTLLFFTAVIVVYSVFVFYFYRFLAKKNIIELNLSQYNQYDNPALVKFFAAILYIFEYIILLPIITFFWFAILSILILLLAETQDVATVLFVSAALVASVRITSYVTQNLSKDLAKMLPFTLLAIAITKPDFFNISALLARISEIPQLFSNITLYLAFIVIIELAMRIIDFFHDSFQSSKVNEEEESDDE
jgi:hypothetical protein